MSEKNKIDDGGPAFPLGTTCEEWMNGMSLRDYFAAKAMMCEIPDGIPVPSTAQEQVAMYAYQMADAMLKARQK